MERTMILAVPAGDVANNISLKIPRADFNGSIPADNLPSIRYVFSDTRPTITDRAKAIFWKSTVDGSLHLVGSDFDVVF